MAVAAWQQCWQIAWRQIEKLHDTTDLGIAKEQVKKAKIWILDSTSLMKALSVLIEIPEKLAEMCSLQSQPRFAPDSTLIHLVVGGTKEEKA